MTEDMPEQKRNPAKDGIVMDVKVGRSLMIGNVKVTVEKKAGQVARLRVVAEEDIVIHRHPLEIAARVA